MPKLIPLPDLFFPKFSLNPMETDKNTPKNQLNVLNSDVNGM